MLDIVLLMQNGIALTMFALIIMVVRTWGPAAYSSARHWLVRREAPSSAKILALAITVGAMTEFGDSLYWFFTWSLYYMDEPLGNTFIQYGVYPNLLFRAIGGALTYYLHYHSSIIKKTKSIEDVRGRLIMSENKYLRFSIGIGIAYIIIMIIAKALIGA